MGSRKEVIPVSTEIDKLTPEGGMLVIVEFDMLEYQKKHNSRAVKKDSQHSGMAE